MSLSSLIPGKRGAISGELPPIISCLGIDQDEWLKTIGWNNRFRRAIGKLAATQTFAEKQGQNWFQGMFAWRRWYSEAWF